MSCCQGCRAIAPTKEVVFLQNIGAVVMRFHRRISGRLCRNCVNEHFAKMTLITAFIGWLGVISAIVTPFYLLNNVIRFLGCLSLKPNPATPTTGTGLAWIAFIAAFWPVFAVAGLLAAAGIAGSHH